MYKKLCVIFLIFTFLLSACRTYAPEGAGVNTPEAQAAAMTFSENSTLFEINPDESEARFLIDEVLRGEDKTVVGTTNRVSGQIAVDFDDPTASAVGPIQVNARGLVTDNNFRNRAIQGRILLTGAYEFVTFTPTAINGLPTEIKLGETVEFEMEGDLTITGFTQSVMFMVTAVVPTTERLEGSATTTIQRRPFDLVIPSATGVAAVAEDIILELDFVATPNQINN